MTLNNRLDVTLSCVFIKQVHFSYLYASLRIGMPPWPIATTLKTVYLINK